MAGTFVLESLGALALDAAAALHRSAFTPLGERAWARQELAELLASPGVDGMLLHVDGRHAGFALFRTVADEAELLTIAVDDAHRRRGVATHMLRALIERVSTSTRALYLEVGVDNEAARALYERFGFEEVGRRAGYYRRGPDKTADALILRLKFAG